MKSPIRLLNDYVRMKVRKMPSSRSSLPIVDREDEIVTELDSSDTKLSSLSQLNEFRTIAEDRETQYNTYDEMATDSVIAAALEIYADDATAYDEQGRIIWVESEDEEIVRAGNRLLDILEIPERAWKHIYQACKYGDYYLKLYREGEDQEDQDKSAILSGSAVKVVNDIRKEKNAVYPYEEYVEDVSDPATVFDLKKKGKTAGFVVVTRDLTNNTIYEASNMSRVYSLKDVEVYRPDRLVHIMISENLTRDPELITLNISKDLSSTYNVSRGKSILYDVYPIQRELQLLEDALLLNRLTRSSLIRLLEIEVGSMPKKEVNNYTRRMKNLIEQKILLDKTTDHYKSYNSPGPIDNVIYIPVRNGQGHISINNLGGDVNVRDIADVDYFNNKRSGALKIPRSFLGDSGEGCLRGSTKVVLADGHQYSIAYMCAHQKEFIKRAILSCGSEGYTVLTTISAIRITRKNAEYVRVTLDNDEYFEVTPDHPCMMHDLTFKEASCLTEGDILKSVYGQIKVISVEPVEGVVEDAYDLQVDSVSHTFLLGAGVFVHNSQLDNGGTLTLLSARYARTIKRIQTSYIRAITNLLNLFFLDKKLDYINKFTVRMTSPSTQEDATRTETINNSAELIESIMRLSESLEGQTQKDILKYLMTNILKMPELTRIINEEDTPTEDISPKDSDSHKSRRSPSPQTTDMTDEFEKRDKSNAEFTSDEFQSFEDQI